MSVVYSEQMLEPDRRKERSSYTKASRATRVFIELELADPTELAEEEVIALKRHLESGLEYLNWQNRDFIDSSQSGWRIRSFSSNKLKTV